MYAGIENVRRYDIRPESKTSVSGMVSMFDYARCRRVVFEGSNLHQNVVIAEMTARYAAEMRTILKVLEVGIEVYQ